ncbi:ABL079Cp [Eremothecium gossypii ATCC 10895]|uniref:Vacuolar membrane-associated protein IML1 n=1 Tax=Eremothecium gossypii (strain ATCC 10895 / CBS 109.51 / FGSC 9923 / NRRL Y-1056) TaxID=284811 RepID=IML1_EREGS|nr:ABL079Cp [Eremothecium gossypii ATCC 10895]Q75DV2.2 RecName: Full=Vacuolar membrane-associated protein IML1 [Eremothecium gossypii ATCC 10895]AAS50692.2 ABL079Cp [Eremothecium gossypii ATCC 10895]
MQSNLLQFSNLRTGNLRLASTNRGSANGGGSSTMESGTSGAGSSSNKQVNMVIENNTLTIGGTEGKRAFGRRLQMDTSGLKVKSKVDQEELESAMKTPISGIPFFNQSSRRSYQFELSFHNTPVSDDCHVLIDVSQLPGAREGDLAELRTYHRSPGTRDKKVYFKIKSLDVEARRRSATTGLSILTGQLRYLLDLPSRSPVWVKLKSKNEHQADLVELHVKDCHVNRGDMWCISSTLLDTCVFTGQRVTYINALRLIVKAIYRNGKKVISGYVGNNTKVIFASESARIIFLIQITEEMWHFEQNGEKTFHKVVNSLFPRILKRWKDIGTYHTITIVFCASVDESGQSFRNIPPGVRLKNTKDYFRIVVDRVNILYWDEIMKTLRKEFMQIIGDLRNTQTDDGGGPIRWSFTPVIKSNILETINFATTLLADQFRVPDLKHTVTHVIIISPGTGLYDVNYDLLKVTCRKLLSLEIAVDLICLSRAPLHIVPLFRYIDYQGELCHSAPTWLSISFWDDNKKSQEWHPRCKIYDVQMMGVTERRDSEEVTLNYMNSALHTTSVTDFMDQYDKEVFDADKCYPLSNENRESTPLEDTSNIESTVLPKSGHEVQSIVWKPPRSSKPLVEPTTVQSVIVSLHQPGTINNSSEDDLTDTSSSNSSPEANESLALASLKNMTQISRGLTKRIVSKLIPDIKSKRSRHSIMATGNEHPRNDTYEDIEDIRKVDCHSTGTNITFLKPTFRSMDAEHYNPPDTVSSHGSAGTDSRRESLMFEKKSVLLDDFAKKKSNVNKYIKEKSLVDSLIHLDNPSVCFSGEVATMLIPDRWKDVYPKYVAKKYTKWRSFTTPAELPITTVHFPSLSDFESNFIFRNHSVSLNIDREVYGQTTFDLLRDMIYIRLLAGFQICTSELLKKVEATGSNEIHEQEIAKVLSKDNYMVAIYYMIIDNEVHRIKCGYNGTIDVQRFLRKNENKMMDTIAKYTPLVRTRYEHSYRPCKMDPLRISRTSLRWNQVDQILAGYYDSMMDSSKIGFRSKFVILPADIPPNTFSSTVNGRKETLSAEEIRLEGLRKLISSISKSRLRTNPEKATKASRKEEILPEVHFYTGSLFEYLADHHDNLEHVDSPAKDAQSADLSKFNRDAELSRLAYELQHGEKPIKLTNRKWHFKNHSSCFVGLEMVNWLIENFSDIDTRDEAVIYGQQLLTDGLFHHVDRRHGFLDGHYFYRISDPFVDIKIEKGSAESPLNSDPITINRRVSASTIISSKQNSSGMIQSKNGDSELLDRQSVNDEGKTIVISTAIDIDLDPAGNSHKLETCTVHYDQVHNPDHCFHIRIEWLTATPKLLDDLVTNWGRLCERYGLRLVEIPWHELCTIPSFDPTHSFIEATLAINPWTDPEFMDAEIFASQKYFYHVHLLESFGFLLDNRASRILQNERVSFNVVYSWGKPSFKYAQFIHNTGAYMAEIRENGDLFLAPNNLYLSRNGIGNSSGSLHLGPKSAIYSEKVMLDFKHVCEDYKKLRSVFWEARDKWQQTRNTLEEY